MQSLDTRIAFGAAVGYYLGLTTPSERPWPAFAEALLFLALLLLVFQVKRWWRDE